MAGITDHGIFWQRHREMENHSTFFWPHSVLPSSLFSSCCLLELSYLSTHLFTPRMKINGNNCWQELLWSWYLVLKHTHTNQERSYSRGVDPRVSEELAVCIFHSKICFGDSVCIQFIQNGEVTGKAAQKCRWFCNPDLLQSFYA